MCGAPILWDAVTGLVLRFDIKADVLVAMAIIAAIALNEYFAAGEVAFIMAIGALLEDYSAAKSNAGIEKLLKLTPRVGRVVCNGEEVTKPSDDIIVGDIIRVLAGESIPVDGKIISGATSIDQSLITGESVPVDKIIDDDVYSGTINQMGAFEMRVTKISAESSFQKMAEMVNSADAEKTKIVRLADKWATYLVAIVALLALSTYLITGDVYRAVTVMIVFCPCAFILATPTAVVAAIGNAAKHGILVRDGDSLEKISQTDIIAFDKTGTLTYGKTDVSDLKSLNGLSYKDLFGCVASAESRSEHPFGKAIVSKYKSEFGIPPEQPQSSEILIGRGLKAVVGNKNVLIGNKALFEENSIEIPPKVLSDLNGFLNEGSTASFISINGNLEGYLVLSDTVRPESKASVDDIRTTGAECVLLTGDNELTAKYVTNVVGIKEYKNNCTPKDKVDYIKTCQTSGKKVCMVGDGINDAPALKTAWVGIAMGKAGSDIAIDAADIALIGDEIDKIAYLRRMSNKMMGKIRFNIIFSLSWNLIAVLFAMIGTFGPVGGALIHNVGSVIVVVNSALLLGYAKHKQSKKT